MQQLPEIRSDLEREDNRDYFVNEIFYSLQGEGARFGTPSIFIRFSGCNILCKKETHGFDCDTEFVSGRKLSLDQIITECKKLNSKSIILTGGEPTLQINQKLIDRLHNEGYYIAVETNGSRRIVYNIDWITVSPKIAEHCIRQTKANEVKYVRCYGQGIPKSIIVCEHYFIIPKYESNVLLDIDLKWCIKLVKENPKWKLGLQLHKHLDIR